MDIKSKVADFIQDFSSSTPFPVAELAEYKGFPVKVFEPSMDALYEVSGVIDYDKKEIYINSYDSPLRQRFTIAHELGHLCLHKKEGGAILDFRSTIFSNNTDTKEMEANEFAAELLMPESIFVEMYRKYSKELYMLSLRFAVSMPAIQIRIANLKKRGLVHE